jgi:hypothetical protein
MASTFSNLGFELQATGENANTWGDKTNVNLELIDERLASIGTFSNTSSFSLSAPSNATKSQANGAATLKFTGSAGSAFTVTMPAKLLLYNVVNLSGQDITFQCSTTTTTATIKSGQNGVIHSDGSANVYLISTVANDFDDDVTITTGDGALLTLRSSEATVVDGDVLGALQFQASGETGTDALAVAASIVAEADNTFAADNNETDLVFKLGQSEAATEKMRLTHEGDVELQNDLTLKSDASLIKFGADSEITLTHVADTGLTLTHTATGAGTPVVLNLKSEEDAIADGDVIGKITFTAGDDSGTDAIATAASIEAEADDTFAADSNKTDLVFKLGSSEAATEKMRLAHEGVLSIPADGSLTTNGIHIGAGADLKIYHTGSHSVINDTGTGNLQLAGSQVDIMGGTDLGETMATFADDGAVTLYYDNSAKIATSSAGVSVTGALTASGDVTAFSDERLKSNIETIDNALDKVMSMRGVSYTKQAEKGVGVIAQEIEKVLPEVVTDGEYKSVAYGNMVGVLIEAIKELKSQLDNHKQGCKCHGTTD